MSMRKRSGSGGKKVLKEKIVQLYEGFFRGESVTLGNINFWEEFFLLKPKMGALESEIGALQADQLSGVRENLNSLVHECITHLSNTHQIKVVYALQTLTGVVRAVYKKCAQLSGFDLVNFLIGFDRAEQEMSSLLNQINTFLTEDSPVCLKDLCLKFLLVLVTGTDNVSSNTLLEYLLITSVFDSLILQLSQTDRRAVHGHQAITILTLLVQYRKHDSSNPYIIKLSILDQEMVLHGYSQVVTSSLSGYTDKYEEIVKEGTGSSWLGTISSMVGTMFIQEDSLLRNERLRSHNPALMALYEIVHLNRNFITTLAHYQTESSNINSENLDDNIVNAADLKSVNLLVTFLEYISIAMQDTKSEIAEKNITLCFIILTCITEDQYATALMHDPNLVFKVKLHRAPMRHRKGGGEVELHGRALVCSLLDLMVEFIRSHMMKRLPLQLHLLAIGCVHKVLAYQRRCRVRITYNWRELWSAMIGLVKFIVGNEATMIKKLNVFGLCLQVVNIFNIYITYGDTFLPSASCYDELYYELVRCQDVFNNLYSMALRYSMSGGEFKDTAMKVTNSLINIRTITSHFHPRIEAWLASQQLSTPSEVEILEVICSNYESLTLKLQESLDLYEECLHQYIYKVVFLFQSFSCLSII
ncbi:UPF0668 protein C10orf76 homolog [Eurytemora carolleeae]|uniref:UPF0668 protein C10orf76 homolog n=1 Tax=Eurytemora carolleeae TaxID=1294199 RepID=UPI000C76BB06|nr:UPF0668 protein C10orf76 homolog [Eurytemora carolleeae]|eukprot:XP_023345372.1 UPF0668 protein C10orf76 homolog [Eurytemora affinis]